MTPKFCKKIITVLIHYTFQYQDLATNEVSSWYLLVLCYAPDKSFFLSMKNNRVQLLLIYEKESYGSCTGHVVSDKTIIVMFV